MSVYTLKCGCQSLTTAIAVALSYPTVTIELSEEGRQTRLVLSQDNNPTEQARDHSRENWDLMLGMLKKLLEE